MRTSLFVPALFILDALFLIFSSTSLSISRYEADIFFHDAGYLGTILELSVALFGQNDLALRFPFILLHLVNLYLLLRVSEGIVKKKEDIALVLFLFVMLPGVNTAALIVSKTGIIIFFTLLFVRLYGLYGKHAYILLPLIALVDNAFIYLFTAVMFYAHYIKKTGLLAFSILSFAVSYYLYGFDFGGRPMGYFLDIFSIYAAIFSPLVFLFFIYALYWQFVKSKTRIPLLWFISAVAFIVSIILSLRQNIRMEDFAPYAVIFVPYMVYAFYNSYRIRLPEFRRAHKIAFSLLIFTLVLNTLVTYFNKPLYLLLDNPKHHFAHEYHFVAELADAIKAEGVTSVRCDTKHLQKRLRFYGIDSGGEYRLSEKEPEGAPGKKIVMRVFGAPVEEYYLYKDKERL